jgi:L-fuculose-phosphate aldolase
MTATSLRSMHEPLLAAAKELNDRGLVEGSSGNLSVRIDERHVCMTPSSIPYDDMVLDDLVVVDLDGEVVEGDKGPTSEKALHLACYRRYPEVGGVIHSHAVHATMFAVAREPIPAVIEEVAVYIGGDVPVCEYTMTGSDELGEVVAAQLADRSPSDRRSTRRCTRRRSWSARRRSSTAPACSAPSTPCRRRSTPGSPRSTS